MASKLDLYVQAYLRAIANLSAGNIDFLQLILFFFVRDETFFKIVLDNSFRVEVLFEALCINIIHRPNQLKFLQRFSFLLFGLTQYSLYIRGVQATAR